MPKPFTLLKGKSTTHRMLSVLVAYCVVYTYFVVVVVLGLPMRAVWQRTSCIG